MLSKVIVLCTFVLVLVNCFGRRQNDDDFRLVIEKLAKHLETLLGIPRPRMNIPQKSIDELMRLSDRIGFRERFEKEQPRTDVLDASLCIGCQSLATSVLNAIKLNQADRLVFIFRSLCEIFVALGTQSSDGFCPGLIHLHQDVLIYIFKNSKIATPDYICTVLLQNRYCYVESAPLTWEIEIPPKPTVLKPPRQGNSNIKNIIHISDFHLSLDYKQGAVADCRYPICCKKLLGNPFLHRERAGKWGNEKYCDLSPELFVETLAHIKKSHRDTQAVYFTGDVVDHSVWETTIYSNSRVLNYSYGQLDRYFGEWKILPVIGNHESIPLNTFAPRFVDYKFSQQWLYDLAAVSWAKWLPGDALETVKLQGYYTTLISPQLRIITLNNNICYRYNWWVLYDTEFLKEQLDFLSRVLESAEKNGEYVHLLYHIPVGNSDCIQPWEHNFNKLVTRFAHIIKGQFAAHTHTDEIKVFFDVNTNKPNNVLFNGASLTTYLNYGPSYKKMEVSPETSEILDFSEYTFNLTHANMHPSKPIYWYFLYNMKSAFNLPNLKPQSIANLARLLQDRPSLFDLYFRYYTRNGGRYNQGCDSNCKLEILCKIVITQYFLYHDDIIQNCQNIRTDPGIV